MFLVLCFLQGKTFQIGTELMKNMGEVTTTESKYSFDGYEVSMCIRYPRTVC